MSKNKVFDFDVANNTVNIREMNEEELTNIEIMKAAMAAQIEQNAEIANKKAIAEAKLAALGLDADDLKALGL
jgi:hypothetical protein